MTDTLSRAAEERKNRWIAMGLTLAINAALLLLFIYVRIWSAEELKLEMPAGGFEVNYGTSEVGGGDVQTYNQANASLNPEESKPSEENIAPNQQKAALANTKEATLLSSKVKSPVQLEEKKITEPVSEAKNTVKKDVKPVEVAPKIDENALFKKKSSNGSKGNAALAGGNSNGNDAGKIGDKGSSYGDINNSAIYKGPKGANGGSGGGTGGGDGLSVNLSGWAMASRPVVNDDSDETGIIRFAIKIDENGSIISLRITETTLSASVAQKYKRAIERISFKPTSSGVRPEVASGTIVFKINSK